MRKRLTDLAVEKLKPDPTSRIEVFDGLLPGLALRVTQRGKKSWSVVYRVAGAGGGLRRGKLRRFTLGSYPLVSVAEARKSARAALNVADHGEDPAQLKADQIRDKHERTFEAVATRFIELHAKPNLINWRAVDRILKEHGCKEWNGRIIDTVTRSEVHLLLDRIVAKRGASTARELRKHLTRLFNWAADRGLIPASPIAGMRRPELHYIARERVLTMDELKAVWRAAENVNYPFGPWLRLLLLTAQRRCEIGSARRPWLLENEAAIEIPASHYKTDRPHVVPLSHPALKIVQALPSWNAGDFLFSTTGGRRPISGFSRLKARIDTSSGVSDWTYHDLRRSAATHMARLGISQEHIERVLGHEIAGVAGTYNRYSYLDEKRAALQRWAREFS